VAGAAVALAASASLAGATVRLRARAVVDAGLVRVSDVARVTCDDDALAGRLRAVTVGRTPPAGEAVSVMRARVEQRVKQRVKGFAAHSVTVTGEPFVTVSTAACPGRAHARAAVAEAVRRSTARELRTSIDAIEVCVLRLDLVDDKAPGADATFAVAARSSGDALGRARYELDVTRPGAVTERVAALTDSALYRPGVVSLRDVEPGETLSIDDLEDAEVAVRDQAARLLDASTDATGRRAARALGTGSALVRADFRADDAVRAGEVVSVAAGSARCRIVDFARAEAAGALGDVICVRNTRSGGAYRARVTGRGRVEATP
jgi:flagella basal body P-ring formation protein FlgA